MSRTPVVVVAAALALLVAGVAAVVVAASSAGGAARAVTPAEAHLAAAYPRAAAAAYGRRVLVLRARPVSPVAGEILESARAGGGWELHPGAPPGASLFRVALDELAARAAADWDAGGRLSPATIARLARGGVAIVVVDDGRRVIAPERAAEVAGVSPEPSVPALRVRGAEPVLRVVGEEPVAGGTRAQLEPARVRDLRDGLWGGSVTIEAREPGTYVLSWPAEGALLRAAADGVTARASVTTLPLLTIDVEAGDQELEVTYGTSAPGGVWAIAGAAAIVAALLALLLALRPHPGREGAGVHGGEDGHDGEGEGSAA